MCAYREKFIIAADHNFPALVAHAVSFIAGALQ